MTDKDIIFASERGIHSLYTTDKTVGIDSTFLSKDIQKTYRDELAPSLTNQTYLRWMPEWNSIVIALTKTGKTSNNWIFGFCHFIRN